MVISFKKSALTIRVPYIEVQLVYRHFKAEPFHAMIDTGSDVTLISQNCYPTQYWKDLKKPIQILVASGQLTLLTKATFGQFIGVYDATTKDHNILPLPTVVIQAPSDASYDILLGIDFLNRFMQFSSDHSMIKLLTPCGHWISAPIVRNRTSRHTISFRPRSQHGGNTYIPKKDPKNSVTRTENLDAFIRS